MVTITCPAPVPAAATGAAETWLAPAVVAVAAIPTAATHIGMRMPLPFLTSTQVRG